MKEDNKIIIYQDDNEVTRVSVRFADEDLWLTQNQLAEIYDTTQENISMHITSIYRDGELAQDRTYKKFLLVRTEGSRQVKRNIDHYNLDMIIALGYRVGEAVREYFLLKSRVFRLPHAIMASIMGINVAPNGVMAYSERGGNSGKMVLDTRPSSTNSLS